jgi:hypothetical protein
MTARLNILEKYQVNSNGCWIWQGYKDKNGYGKVGTRWAHRVVYEYFKGPIPEGLVIDHLCRVPLCVNTSHLEVVTPRENMLRGEAPSAIIAKNNTCPRGHALVEGNVYSRPDGKGRNCKTCTTIRIKTFRATEEGKLQHRELNKRSRERLKARANAVEDEAEKDEVRERIYTDEMEAKDKADIFG